MWREGGGGGERAGPAARRRMQLAGVRPYPVARGPPSEGRARPEACICRACQCLVVGCRAARVVCRFAALSHPQREKRGTGEGAKPLPLSLRLGHRAFFLISPPRAASSFDERGSHTTHTRTDDKREEKGKTEEEADGRPPPGRPSCAWTEGVCVCVCVLSWLSRHVSGETAQNYFRRAKVVTISRCARALGQERVAAPAPGAAGAAGSKRTQAPLSPLVSSEHALATVDLQAQGRIVSYF